MAYNEDVVKEQAKRYDSFYLYDESQYPMGKHTFF